MKKLLFTFICLLTTITAQEKNKIKNVLFIISDDLKASTLGAYGDKVCKTPNIDKLAAEGMVFTRTYCQGTVCGPSRLSFMHSRYRGRAESNIGNHFIKNGYYSARVGKIYHMRVPGDIIAGTHGGDIKNTWTERFNCTGQEAHTPGDYACLNLNIFTNKLEGRQSTQMPHRMYVTVSYEGDGSDQPDHKAATKTIELIQKNKDKPFFIATGFVRPHYPMVAPKKYFDMYPLEDIKIPQVPKNDLNDIPKIVHPKENPINKMDDNIKRMWAGYYATITFMDEQVGRIIKELERLGLRDSTAIVFTSDHGYHLGEHGYWQKNDLHEEVTRVPLIISAPGFKPGRSESITELMDIFPTLTSLTGLNTPESVQGKSLLPILKSSSAVVKDSALSFTPKGVGMRTKDWAYMKYKDGSEELYNMVKDPSQFTNLVNNPEYKVVLDKHRQAFSERLKKANYKFKFK